MKKELIGIFLCMLLVGTVLPVTGTILTDKSNLPLTNSNILYVGGSGPSNYSKIKYAIENATDGDTVFVFDDSSPYYETVRVDKSISLLGENRDTTIIDAGGRNYVVTLLTKDITVSGFTLQNSGDEEYNDAGIRIENWNDESYRNKIIGNKMINNGDGIFFWNSDYNTISDNIIINNRDDGIFFQAYNEKNRIAGNIIANNNGYGISIYQSETNFIHDNNISNNSKAGIFDCGFSEIYNNIFTNSKTGALIGSNCHVYKNEFSHNQLGLHVQYTSSCLVENNNFIDNEIDATFSYFLLDRLIIPFLVSPQLTKWRHNYWADNIIGPKIIHGSMIPFYIFSMFFELPFIRIPWINFDFFPAIRPHDISKLESWY